MPYLFQFSDGFLALRDAMHETGGGRAIKILLSFPHKITDSNHSGHFAAFILIKGFLSKNIYIYNRPKIFTKILRSNVSSWLYAAKRKWLTSPEFIPPRRPCWWPKLEAQIFGIKIRIKIRNSPPLKRLKNQMKLTLKKHKKRFSGLLWMFFKKKTEKTCPTLLHYTVSLQNWAYLVGGACEPRRAYRPVLDRTESMHSAVYLCGECAFSDMLRTLWCRGTQWATRLKRQVGGVHDQLLNDGPNSIVCTKRCLMPTKKVAWVS